jgi:GNAT superfamily N-acetyltransferase
MGTSAPATPLLPHPGSGVVRTEPGRQPTPGGPLPEEDENSLCIHPATWDDASDVIDIIRSSASWYEELVDPGDLGEHLVDEAWARENFRRRDFHVGTVNDEVVGTISLQSVGRRFLYLGYVYLHVDHVGNGFGGDLLDFARDEGRRRGREALVLIAHPDAHWACRAYEKYGFRVIARERDEVLAWEGGWLEPYYEEGFHLFRYDL